MKKYSYTHIGKRENQEDALGFIENLVYLVCDGVGGNTKGEVASNFVVESLLNLVKDSKPDYSKLYIQNTLSIIQSNLNNKLATEPNFAGMGTTFCGVFVGENSIYLAHIGDSRIYYIRPSEEKIWHTWDHSLVGELMRTNEITREDGRFHPMGNRISKAIIANMDNKTTKADIVRLNEIKSNDLILICTDGVTESWSEYELTKMLCDTNISSEDKLENIKTKCVSASKDNNTAILLEIEDLDVFNSGSNEEISWLSLNDFKFDFDKYTAKNEINTTAETPNEVVIPLNSKNDSDKPIENKSNKNKYKLFLLLMSIAIVLFGLFNIFNNNKGKTKKKNDDDINISKQDSSTDKQQNLNNVSTVLTVDNSGSQNNSTKLKTDSTKFSSITKQTNKDSLYWISISKNDDTMSYKSYLAKYPKGNFSSQASMKLKLLRERQNDTKPILINPDTIQ